MRAPPKPSRCQRTLEPAGAVKMGTGAQRVEKALQMAAPNAFRGTLVPGSNPEAHTMRPRRLKKPPSERKKSAYSPSAW